MICRKLEFYWCYLACTMLALAWFCHHLPDWGQCTSDLSHSMITRNRSFINFNSKFIITWFLFGFPVSPLCSQVRAKWVAWRDDKPFSSPSKCCNSASSDASTFPTFCSFDDRKPRNKIPTQKVDVGSLGKPAVVTLWLSVQSDRWISLFKTSSWHIQGQEIYKDYMPCTRTQKEAEGKKKWINCKTWQMQSLFHA